MALQEAIQPLGGSQDPATREEPLGTHSPQKDQLVLKGPETPPQPNPTGTNGPQKDPVALKGPEVPPQPITHQEAPSSGSPPEGPKEPLAPLRASEHPEEDGALKGGPQKGAKEGPPESGHQGPIKTWLNQGSKSQGSNLKAPASRSQRSSAKVDAKVIEKARQ